MDPYLDEQEFLRRLRVLGQDADGGIFQQYKDVIKENLDKGVAPFQVFGLLKDMGFRNTARLFEKWMEENGTPVVKIALRGTSAK